MSLVIWAYHRKCVKWFIKPLISFSLNKVSLSQIRIKTPLALATLTLILLLGSSVASMLQNPSLLEPKTSKRNFPASKKLIIYDESHFLDLRRYGWLKKTQYQELEARIQNFHKYVPKNISHALRSATVRLVEREKSPLQETILFEITSFLSFPNNKIGPLLDYYKLTKKRTLKESVNQLRDSFNSDIGRHLQAQKELYLLALDFYHVNILLLTFDSLNPFRILFFRNWTNFWCSDDRSKRFFHCLLSDTFPALKVYTLRSMPTQTCHIKIDPVFILNWNNFTKFGKFKLLRLPNP